MILEREKKIDINVDRDNVRLSQRCVLEITFRKPRSRLLLRCNDLGNEYENFEYTLSTNSLSTRPNKSGKSVTIQTVRTAVVSHMYCPFYGDTERYVLCEIVFVELRNSMSRKLYSISY